MTVNIGATVRLRSDEDAYDTPQGTVFVAGSNFFQEQDGGEMQGFWQVCDTRRCICVCVCVCVCVCAHMLHMGKRAGQLSF